MSRSSMSSTRSTTELEPGSLTSIANLVYKNRGDFFTAGFKQPTTKDIPQIRLPKIDNPNTDLVFKYANENADASNTLNCDLASPELPDLSVVPEVFFQPDFQLDNPRIFNEVINQDSTVTQEKLSWFIDIVEVHLEHEVAMMSSSFFMAAAQFSNIEHDAQQINLKLVQFEENAKVFGRVIEHLKLTKKLQLSLRNVQELNNGLRLLTSLKTKISQLESELQSKNVELSSQLVLECTDLLGEFEFSKVHAAQLLLENLEICTANFKNLVITSFADEMTSWLTTGSKPLNVIAIETVHMHNIKDQCLKRYLKSLDEQIRLGIKQFLPEDSNLALSLHKLKPDEAEQMFQKIYNYLLTLLENLVVQITEFQDFDGTLLTEFIESVDTRLVKILRVRKDPATLLNTSEFLKFFISTSKFCLDLENLSESKPLELEEFLVAQTKLYIHSLQELHTQNLLQFMDRDDWRRVEVPKQVQESIDLVLSAGSMDPVKLLKINENQSYVNVNSNSKSRILAGSESFPASKSICNFTGILVQYVHLIVHLPNSHTPALALSMLELCRSFNMRCHYLILGFGATRTAAKLKHVSVKNMLLASEALRLIHLALPYLKRLVERHMQTMSNILDEFDSVQQALFDHRKEIRDKLISLMSGNITQYCKRIESTDWKLRADPANKYMLDLMKQTTVVSNFATEMLPPSMARNLVMDIYSVYKPILLQAFSTIMVTTRDEKVNVLRDLDYFRSKSEVLKGAGNTADVVFESVNGFVGPDIDVSLEQANQSSAEPPAEPTVDVDRVSTDTNSDLNEGAVMGERSSSEPSVNGSRRESEDNATRKDVPEEPKDIPKEAEDVPKEPTEDPKEPNETQEENEELQDDSKDSTDVLKDELKEEPHTEPEAKSREDVLDKQSVKRPEESTEKAAEEPVVVPTVEPTQEATKEHEEPEKPAEKPTAEPTAEPSEEPSVESEESTEKPEMSTHKSSDGSTEELTVELKESVKEPTEESSQVSTVEHKEPTEKPEETTEKSTEEPEPPTKSPEVEPSPHSTKEDLNGNANVNIPPETTDNAPDSNPNPDASVGSKSADTTPLSNNAMKKKRKNKKTKKRK